LQPFEQVLVALRGSAVILDRPGDRRGADAIFVSCTSLCIAAAIAEIESASGPPLVTSNQALAWHCLQLAGRPARLSGFGRLLAA
jgi:maleate isomerase